MPRMSQAEYESHLARRRPLDAPAAEGVDDEAQLHRDILDECARRMWIAFHCRMDRPSTTTVGQPDFIICADGGRTFYVEAKTRKRKLSTEQAALKAWAEKLGHTVHVVRSLAQFLEVVGT